LREESKDILQKMLLNLERINLNLEVLNRHLEVIHDSLSKEQMHD
jgi:hypothetical protein